MYGFLSFVSFTWFRLSWYDIIFRLTTNNVSERNIEIQLIHLRREEKFTFISLICTSMASFFFYTMAGEGLFQFYFIFFCGILDLHKLFWLIFHRSWIFDYSCCVCCITSRAVDDDSTVWLSFKLIHYLWQFSTK